MDHKNFDPVQSLKDELTKQIKIRRKYEGWDFKLAHFLIWASIFASFSSSIIIAAGVQSISKIWLAIIAGVPGVVVVVEKSFDFARRTAWDTMYKIDLQELKDKIDFGKIDIYSASEEYRKIARRNEAEFLKIGFFSQERKDASDGIEGKTGNNIDAKKDL